MKNLKTSTIEAFGSFYGALRLALTFILKRFILGWIDVDRRLRDIEENLEEIRSEVDEIYKKASAGYSVRTDKRNAYEGNE